MVDEKEKFTKMDKGKFLLPLTTAAGNNNSVLDRVKSFLPQLAKANATLKHDQSTLDPTQLSLKYNLEDIPESTPKVIEMDLALGVLEQQPQKDSEIRVPGILEEGEEEEIVLLDSHRHAAQKKRARKLKRRLEEEALLDVLLGKEEEENLDIDVDDEKKAEITDNLDDDSDDSDSDDSLPRKKKPLIQEIK